MLVRKINLCIYENTTNSKLSNKYFDYMNLLENIFNKEDYNGNEWVIKTDMLYIQVNIKICKNYLDINRYAVLNNDESIVLFIANGLEKDKNVFTSNIDKESLKSLSQYAQIVFAVPLEYPYDKENKLFLYQLQSELPFIEYFFPINNNFDKFSNFSFDYDSSSVFKQIIINKFPESLNYAKELIYNNFKSKDPYLDLGNCGLTSLNDVKELFNNEHLKTLILSNEWSEITNGHLKKCFSKNKYNPNVLFSIPDDIIELCNIETLIIGGDWIKYKNNNIIYNTPWVINNIDILSSLSKLKYLNISNNNISTLSPLIGLSNLKVLHANNNIIVKIPSIQYYPSLTDLFISNNRINNVGFLSYEKTKLNTVDLHSNEITDITPIKLLVNKLNIFYKSWIVNSISIYNNPLSIPPVDIVAKGKHSVELYYNKLDAEQKIKLKPYINDDIKLILVGNSGVGKSTFVHWLKYNKIDKSIESTHWMNFGICDIKKGTKKYKVRIFDFGGQDYYHDTHHLFFTNRTAYVLLWDKLSNKFGQLEIDQTKDSDIKKIIKFDTFPLEYWLDSIRYHTQKRQPIKNKLYNIINNNDNEKQNIQSVSDLMYTTLTNMDSLDQLNTSNEEENIFIVQNKVDRISSKSFLNEFELKNKYPNIYDYDFMSLHEEKRLNLIRDTLFDVFDNLEIIKKQYLGTWFHVKNIIENSKFNNRLTLDEFKGYCNDIILKLPELLNKPQNQINKVLFSIDDTKDFASFLADIGLCLYYPDNSNLSQIVFLNLNTVVNEINKVLLHIDRKNGEITENEIVNSLSTVYNEHKINDIINLMLHFKMIFKHPILDKHRYIAPLYLPSDPPVSVKLFDSIFNKPIYIYQYNTFIHKSIILDIFHKYGAKALSQSNDDSSFYFWKNGIIIKDDNDIDLVKLTFSFWNEGSTCAYLKIYTSTGKISNLVETLVKHIDLLNQGINAIKLVPNETYNDYIPLDIVLKNENNNILLFHFNDKYYKLTSFNSYLSGKLKMKKIFISYSKLDLGMVTRFIDHLSALKLDGKVSHWYCSELEAGSKWNDEIQKKLEEADIICFMISPNFMKTEYIHEHEIKNAFERKNKDPNFKIVPIILNFCRWTTINNNLGDYTALPYTAKPVMDFKNQDKAWYIIEECLRVMIDNDIDLKNNDFYNNKKLPSDVLNIFKQIVEGKVDDSA